MTVPFRPPTTVVRECTNLIQAVAVPRLSNQLGVPKDRIFADQFNKSRIAHRRASREASSISYGACTSCCSSPAGKRLLSCTPGGQGTKVLTLEPAGTL